MQMRGAPCFAPRQGEPLLGDEECEAEYRFVRLRKAPLQNSRKSGVLRNLLQKKTGTGDPRDSALTSRSSFLSPGFPPGCGNELAGLLIQFSKVELFVSWSFFLLVPVALDGIDINGSGLLVVLVGDMSVGESFFDSYNVIS